MNIGVLFDYKIQFFNFTSIYFFLYFFFYIFDVFQRIFLYFLTILTVHVYCIVIRRTTICFRVRTESYKKRTTRNISNTEFLPTEPAKHVTPSGCEWSHVNNIDLIRPGTYFSRHIFVKSKAIYFYNATSRVEQNVYDM